MSAATNRSVNQALTELIRIVAQLRNPEGGCSWDLEQTHTSLIPHLLEEAHEVADAIRQETAMHLCEELGDLLFQIILRLQGVLISLTY